MPGKGEGNLLLLSYSGEDKILDDGKVDACWNAPIEELLSSKTATSDTIASVEKNLQCDLFRCPTILIKVQSSFGSIVGFD